MNQKGEKRIIIGITGASGAIYAVRTVRALVLAGFEVHLVVSHFGERLLAEEAGVKLAKDGFDPIIAEALARSRMAQDSKLDSSGGGHPPAIHTSGQNVGSIVRHGIMDLGASIASGSFQARGMIVVPCTTKSLAGIANGLSGTLIERAADVCLKERRPVALVVREAPLSLIHLRNMVAAAEAGATIIPASPAFYQKPANFDDLGDFIAGRALSILGIEHRLFPAWMEED